MKNSSIQLRFLIFLILLILLIGPLAYLLNFSNHPISNNSHDWGSFGDYIGGILNPIISLLSVVVLGYLTYFVYKHSSLENKNVFYLEQKTLAFQYISKLSNNIDIYKEKSSLHFDITISARKLTYTVPANEQLIKSMESIEYLSELKVGYSNFGRNYGHLFKYDFESDDYKLLQSSINFYLSDLKANLSTNLGTEVNDRNYHSLKAIINKFMSVLQEELNNTA